MDDRRVEGTIEHEIAYLLGRQWWGKGYATEAAAALTRVGIQLCGMERMELQVEPENEPSLRVARKLGYREEGVRRRHLEPLVPGGLQRDAVVFSLLAEELEGSPCAAAELRAFNVAGKPLALR